MSLNYTKIHVLPLDKLYRMSPRREKKARDFFERNNATMDVYFQAWVIGAHRCPEWDYLYITPCYPEWDACSCE